MKAKDLRERSLPELEEEAVKCRRVLLDLRVQRSTQKLEDVRRMGNVRKDLARTLTIIGERKRSKA